MDREIMRHRRALRSACQRGAALIVAAVLMLPEAALPQSACRTDALGTTVCGTPPPVRPRARPLVDDRTHGLDRVMPPPSAGSASPEVIPGRRTNTFGRTILSPGETGSRGRCRTDTLGNLRCP